MINILSNLFVMYIFITICNGIVLFRTMLTLKQTQTEKKDLEKLKTIREQIRKSIIFKIDNNKNIIKGKVFKNFRGEHETYKIYSKDSENEFIFGLKINQDNPFYINTTYKYFHALLNNIIDIKKTNCVDELELVNSMLEDLKE